SVQTCVNIFTVCGVVVRELRRKEARFRYATVVFPELLGKRAPLKLLHVIIKESPSNQAKITSSIKKSVELSKVPHSFFLFVQMNNDTSGIANIFLVDFSFHCLFLFSPSIKDKQQRHCIADDLDEFQ